MIIFNILQIFQCPMEAVYVSNGCMWFIPGSHKDELRAHRPAAPGVHVLTCCDAVGEVSSSEANILT